MKVINFKTIALLLIVFTVFATSCADLSVDNLNDPTRETVLGNPENTLKLLKGGYYDFATTMVSSWGVHIHMLADQNTSTNLYNQYWDFSDEPRRRLNNTTTYSATAVFTSFFGGFNASIATANIFIKDIEVDGNKIMDGGTDISDEVLAQAYFLRGLARGYLGLIYDQGYLLDENFDVTTDVAEFKPYTEIIEAALSDIDEAISIVEGMSSFEFNVMPNEADSWDKAEFLDIANSFAARIAAGKARTADEAANLDWDAILAYANKGLGGPDAQSTLHDFSPSNVGSSGDFANYLADWLNFLVAGAEYDDPSTPEDDRGAGYNPIDIKQIHLLDPNYPTEYPEELASSGVAGLAPADTLDPRITYFQYTPNPGYLNPTRNAKLFTNYFSFRYYAYSDWWPSQFKVTLITDTEVDLIRAEANLWKGNLPAVGDILENSSAGTEPTVLSYELPGAAYGFVDQNSLAGGHTYDGSENRAELEFALLREYSVELDLLGGVGLQWFFMRRYDMLQAGTALHYPVPGSELELLGLENYTFGGASYTSEAGTATGANSWKNLAATAGLVTKVRAKASANAPTAIPNPKAPSDLRPPIQRSSRTSKLSNY